MTEVVCSQMDCKYNNESGVCNAMKVYLNSCAEPVYSVCLNYKQGTEDFMDGLDNRE